MIFTCFDYLPFMAAVFTLYWLLRRKMLQNALLLVASYVFYGYIHPWFCFLIAASTTIDYLCALGMGRHRTRRRVLLIISVAANLGMLGFFKYFNFFADNIAALAGTIGFPLDAVTVRIILPVGISFYTFQSLSYTIDVYRGKLAPRRNFIDVALFVAFFPQLVAGPIERAVRFLPQIETPRRWDSRRFAAAWPLLVRGYLKKLVIADTMAIYADKVYMLAQPEALLLVAGTVAFALQIYADFSAYTDIARGTARLLGFELTENFRSPYLAVSPSDFWRRWHISFSSWIRDYLYIPLGGSRASSRLAQVTILLVSLGLSGLWHGAAWNFIAWGIYHALLVIFYRALGRAGHWRPNHWAERIGAWFVMSSLTLIGWMIFRAPSLSWLISSLRSGAGLGFSGDSLIASLVMLTGALVYSLPLLLFMFLDRAVPRRRVLHALTYALAIVAMLLFAQDRGFDFIYFQF